MGSAAGFAQHPAAQRDNDVTLFGQGDEGVRPQQPFLRMLPAQQGLDCDDAQVAEAVARLVVQLEFLVAQGSPHVVLQLAAVLDLLVHFGSEIAPGALAVGLGLVQGDIGAADQLAGIEALGTGLGDSDAGANMEGLAIEGDRLLQQADQARTETVDLAAVVHAAEHQEELVAAQTRDQVAVAGSVAQAVRYLLQHRVTGGMAERVVDRLEVVQVQQQQGQWWRVAPT